MEAAWNVMFAAYCQEYPEMEALWNQYHDEHAAEKFADDADFWAKGEKPEATRALSGKVLNSMKEKLDRLRAAAESNDAERMVALLHEICPTFRTPARRTSASRTVISAEATRNAPPTAQRTLSALTS